MSPHPTPVATSFGEALKFWLEQRGLSAPELARKMDVDRTLPAHWLANRKAPSIEDLLGMMAALTIPARARADFMRLAADERARIKERRRDERAAQAAG